MAEAQDLFRAYLDPLYPSLKNITRQKTMPVEIELNKGARRGAQKKPE